MMTGTLKILSGLGLKHAKKVTKICIIVSQMFKKLKKNGGEARIKKTERGHTFNVFL